MTPERKAELAINDIEIIAGMLSEMRISPAEKCEMAYEYALAQLKSWKEQTK